MSMQVHWLGHCGPAVQRLSSSVEPEGEEQGKTSLSAAKQVLQLLLEAKAPEVLESL